MIRVLLPALAAALLPACDVTARRSEPPRPRTVETRVEWRMAERTYATLDASWANALDGAIDPDSVALVHERVSKAVQVEEGGTIPVPSACTHGVHAEMVGGATRRVGESAEILLSIDGRDHSHLLRIEATSAAVQVLDVRGATPLDGAPGSYMVPPGAHVRVRFTSQAPGTAGLRLSVEPAEGDRRPSASRP